jgi:hypothetical protein
MDIQESILALNPKVDAAWAELVATKASSLTLRQVFSACIIKITQREGRCLAAIFSSMQDAFANAKNNREDFDLRLYVQLTL